MKKHHGATSRCHFPFCWAHESQRLEAPLYCGCQSAKAFRRWPDITDLVGHISRVLSFVDNPHDVRGKVAEETERLKQFINVRRKLRSALDQ